MPSAEFTEWLVYFARLDAEAEVVEARLDWRVAMQLQLLANVSRDEKKRPRPFTTEEFLPRWQGAVEEPPPTDDEVRAAVHQMNATFGGRVVRD